MKLQFNGATKTVTGSCHLITLENGFNVLLDCGLYQGNEAQLEDFNSQWYFNPAEIDVLILSHAHIDHCGRIPKLVKDGFKGKIYCTSATRDLAVIMLMDSAQIQENDAEYESRKLGKNKKPLYTIVDAKNCFKYFRTIEYNNWFAINDDIQALFLDAGHILGSATITLKIKEQDKETTLGFTGDVSRFRRPILNNPVSMPTLDILITESTYGGKTHEDEPQSNEKLLQIINDTCIKKRGKLIIPAFSLGRTQELLYKLNNLYNNGKISNIPVYVDSPLAMNASHIYMMHPECFDDEVHSIMRKDDDPFGWNNMRYIKNAEQSKILNTDTEPCIIIAASGMATGGRVKHHLFHQLDKPENTILMVGYCAEGTLGKQLIDNAEKVTIFHQEINVLASIVVMNSMSAHADQPELLRFISNQHPKNLKKIFLVHGEPKNQVALKEALTEKGFTDIQIPTLGEVFDV
jgi:metallo-beta-lactamase family protein